MYLALVRGLLPWVVGDLSCFESTVDLLEEGVCFVLEAGSGVSHRSQLSMVSSSVSTGLLER
jgi:hypothetical protein